MKLMTPAELRVAIAQLGIGEDGLAQAIQVTKRTVYKWLAGERTVSPQAAILIRIMVAKRNWNDILTIGYGGSDA
jgi:DNA-binding transcriptional regulator YiaG